MSAPGRHRNLSPWAYWSLHLRDVVADDPPPRDDAQLDAWRRRVRLRVRALLGPDPESVALDVEETERTDCGTYERLRVLYDADAAMTVPAYLLVPKARHDPGPESLGIHGQRAGEATDTRFGSLNWAGRMFRPCSEAMNFSVTVVTRVPSRGSVPPSYHPRPDGSVGEGTNPPTREQ